MIQDYTANLSPEKAKVKLRILAIDTAKIDVIVKVQEELRDSSGIRREGNLAFTLAGRDRRIGDKKIRDSTITYYDHISRFEDNDPTGRKVLAFVGNSNLLMNPWFVAWVEGKLFHIKSEPVFEREKPYSSLVVWKDKRVTIEDIWFRPKGIMIDHPTKGKNIVEDVLFTTYGQRLRSQGVFVPPVTISEQYYDLRHLLLFPFLSDEESYLGLYDLERDEDKKQKALKKLPVEVELKVDHNRAKKALDEKNYWEAEQVGKEGQYHISGDKMCIAFKSGLFPHNIIGVDENGRVISIVVSGWSNTAGVMLDLADKLFMDIEDRYGILVNDAILLDNGADVMMWYRGKMEVESFTSPPRDRLRSVILFAAEPGGEGGTMVLQEM